MADEAAKQQIIQDLKDLIDRSKNLDGLEIKEELEKLIPTEQEETNSVHHESDTSDEEVEEVTGSVSKIKLSQISKMRKYLKEENFSTFCERFKEYVYITNMEDKNLYIFFLQNVDDETYSELKSVPLSAAEKKRSFFVL